MVEKWEELYVPPLSLKTGETITVVDEPLFQINKPIAQTSESILQPDIANMSEDELIDFLNSSF